MNTQTTLAQLYSDGLPDDDELFWEYITNSDLKKPVTIEKIDPAELKRMVLKHHQANQIGELNSLLTKQQKSVINHYRKSPNLSDSIIVTYDDMILDGYHRALAAILNNVPINVVRLENLEE